MVYEFTAFMIFSLHLHEETILSPFDMWYIIWEPADISVNPFCEMVSLYNLDTLPN